MNWKIAVYTPQTLSAADRTACVEVITEGDAVDPVFAAAELPYALRLAIAWVGTSVVGVIVIKRARSGYAASVAKKSGFAFPADLPELGYAAVRKAHQRIGIGGSLVAEILASYGKMPLFATTSHPAMKKHLAEAGFGQFGKTWTGKHGELTLWLLKHDKRAAASVRK